MQPEASRPGPAPDKIMQIATAHWATQILARSVEFDLFTHLDRAPGTTAELAPRAGISERGAQALLDGLLGLSLLRLEDGRYHNTQEAATFLVRGKPTFLGFAAMAPFDWNEWEKFGEAIKRGGTTRETSSYEQQDYKFWEELVLAIAPLAIPAAEAAAAHLGLGQRDAFHMLDVGGGSGAYSAVWLRQNPAARATQLDWPHINQVAREFVTRFSVADRFETIDGNLLERDFGEDLYDYAIFSHMAHGLSPAQNRETIAKFRRALKPGGVLLIGDFVLDDERRGHPMALLFYSNMLQATAEGRTYTEGEYRRWLEEAGFEMELQPLAPMPVTLIYGR